jgi:hypothetical protein
VIIGGGAPTGDLHAGKSNASATIPRLPIVCRFAHLPTMGILPFNGLS